MSVTPNRHADWSKILVASAAYTVADHGLFTTAVRIPNAAAYVFLLDVTAAATDNVDTLDVFIQTRLATGIWIDIVHFDQIVGDATPGDATRSVAKVIGVLGMTNTTSSDNTRLISSATDVSKVLHLAGDEYRLKTNIIDANADAEFTFSVHVMPMSA